MSQYEAFIFDIWGVLHNGSTPYPNATHLFQQLNESARPYLLLSNTSRSAHFTSQQLQAIDFVIPPERIVTSGDMVRRYLYTQTQNPSTHQNRYFLLSRFPAEQIVGDLEMELVNQIEQADVLIISTYSEENEDKEVHCDMLERAASLGLPAICTNPDKIVPHENTKRYCAGFFSELYEKMGGNVSYFGKPHASIFTEALGRLKMPTDRILMVGDTLETDIKGAHNAKIDSALMLTGNGENWSAESVMSDTKHPTWIVKHLCD